MALDFNAELEELVLSTGPEDTPDMPAIEAENIDDQPPQATTIAAPELTTESVFYQQFVFMHEMAGGMVTMRTGAPCPLGDQAKGEGGQAASSAMYNLIKSSPALANFILSTKSTFFAQLGAIGMHGFGCVQVIKAAMATPVDQPETEAAA
ncbi:MAG: hypothetical protein GQ535_11135 [Rhodobacteraceae bacterium]|nr:hypothetical protein [Paracoccaceae bacterium]